MWPTLGIGLLTLAHAARHRGTRDRTLAALCLATAGSGLLGALTGMIRTMQFAASHPLEQQIRFVLIGTSESLHNVTLALVLLIPTALVTAARRR